MKIQSPWMGRIKGSAGNMTGCKVFNKNVMRAKAFEVNNPNTAAQQVQRGYFADLTKLVAGFTPDQLRTLFPNKPKAMSRRNALAKQLAGYNTMQGSEKVVDFANIDTLGNAPMAKIEASNISFEQTDINIEFNKNQFNEIQTNDTKILAVLINETKSELSFTTEYAAPIDELLTLVCPNGWSSEDSVHAILLVAETKEQNLSFGSFIIKVRPEKKSN